MRNNAVPRKDLQKILLVNWSRFTAETIKVSNSVLITGVNGTGKIHRPGRGVLRGIRKP